MNQVRNPVGTSMLLLMVALAGVGAACAEETVDASVRPLPPMDFVGEWPPVDATKSSPAVGTSRTGAIRAAHAAPATARDSSRCLQWAAGRINALWHSTVYTVRTAWLRAWDVLFGPSSGRPGAP